MKVTHCLLLMLPAFGTAHARQIFQPSRSHPSISYLVKTCWWREFRGCVTAVLKVSPSVLLRSNTRSDGAGLQPVGSHSSGELESWPAKRPTSEIQGNTTRRLALRVSRSEEAPRWFLAFCGNGGLGRQQSGAAGTIQGPTPVDAAAREKEKRR
ncbi:hypothetical protein N658DRAFT_500303 [Parathielavia hyrcaniae]|uniref:Secreted protein n=1 Tax=Parathielavia hyrcaniae TaxID=113614 RepID=A0AAN6PWS0_9PEZI|nr:hypothetical protein N658DRAFT_500303 [Parathielavia hyrcaniae]